MALLAIAGIAAGAAYLWTNRALPLRQPTVELSVEPGMSAQAIARAWVDAGVDASPEMLARWFRLSGKSTKIRAGSYAVEAGVTPRELLDKMVEGDETMETVQLPEGQTFRQWREVLAQAPHLRQTIGAMSDAQVAQAVGVAASSPEGWFFPDTYRYGRGVTDLTLLRRSHEMLQKRLDAAWQSRSPQVVVKTPAEALTLASIVEKETGRPQDRAHVAAVFNNRLRIGMRLQTDPTVIYGIGAKFDGNLRRRDLETDTPYNSYTRAGLPPTPISMPSGASIKAAMQPADSKALYFVARGDGTSQFSESLREHNKAVDDFQRRPAAAARAASRAAARP